ncbi:hypothetical protein WMY93_027147 [Mugilogobius chulae]|uniref:THAP-type domain-containing protein n=1 Tax=Mugilogobius chulae TaxID=88201 RepID=A0AAW0MYW5_9GOBI
MSVSFENREGERKFLLLAPPPLSRSNEEDAYNPQSATTMDISEDISEQEALRTRPPPPSPRFPPLPPPLRLHCARLAHTVPRLYSKSKLFGMPTEEARLSRWLEFISGNTDKKVPKNVFVCERHFTEDSFENYGHFKAGLTTKQKLRLNKDAVPTIPASRDGDPTPESAPSQPPSTEYTSRSVATRTVSTQLSAGTLKSHTVRSKGVQTKITTKDSCTETDPSWLGLSSTPVKETPGISYRPRKRQRIEMEEDDEEEDVDISDISPPQPHDSTYEPGASVTDVSELTEIGQPTGPNYEGKKYIVFESRLKELFQTCPVCNCNSNVKKRESGTFVAFTQSCPHCLYHREWESQPVVGSTPVGNLQLSAAVYFSGGSFIKMEKICKAMSLQVHQYSTFRRHSRSFLEPAIYHKWKKDQGLIFEELKGKGKLALGWRHASRFTRLVFQRHYFIVVWHSAKYGSYTLMELQSERILDIQLVQSNEVGGSYHMEKEGLRRCLDLVQASSLEVDYLVTDRHTQVKAYLRERKITQYYDVWHLEKGLSKKLEKLSKVKECELIKKWLPAIKNHIYWVACSSTSGQEKTAKWKSLINHIQNVHTHPDPEFPRCAHPDRVSRDPSKWFQPGTVALYKVEKLLVNKRVLGDVEKLSSDYQTSSLEAFHSVVIRFAPKSVVYPFVGMLCRLYLAGMHFNENAKRYVSELMHLVFTEVFPDPGRFFDQLNAVPVPEDLSAQFEKAPKKRSLLHTCLGSVGQQADLAVMEEAHILLGRVWMLRAFLEYSKRRNDCSDPGSK